MPGWILSALALIRSSLFGGPIRAALTGATAGTFGSQIFDGDGDVVVKRRRRRKRALTASDRADIGFITGLLGPAAGKAFALTIASR